jgi:hypothetical protein
MPGSLGRGGSTSGGNLCHLLVRRARNLAMSKSVAPVVVMRLLSTVARAAPGGARISGLITRRRRLRHIMNSNCRSTAIRAAQDLVIDDDLVLGFLQFEA